MKTHIGLDAAQTQVVAAILSPLLADEFLLYLKTRNAHWNVEGADFHTMHIYFEQLYAELEIVVDNVAERLRKIGHYAPASMKHYLELTHLAEERETKHASLSFIADLLSDHEEVIMYLRKSIDKISSKGEYDYGTSDFLTTLMEQHEKTAWMLRSHLK